MSTIEYVKAKRASTVQMTDKTHRSVKENEPIKVDDLSDFFQEELFTVDSWTSKIFATATVKEYDAWQAGNHPVESPDFDKRLAEMGHLVIPGPGEGEMVVGDGDNLKEAKDEETKEPTAAEVVASGAAPKEDETSTTTEEKE